MENIREFTTSFGCMKYLMQGDKPLYAVILQGWNTNHKLYEDIICELLKKYTVIFPMLQGFSESEEPKCKMSVEDYAESVNSLLEYLRIERADFFCHSYGGRVFFKLCANENTFTKVNKVILTDVAGVMPKKSAKTKLKIRMYKISRKILSLKIVKYFFPDALDNLRKKNGSADYNSASPIMKETLKLAVNEDLTELFCKVTAPCLILWGRNDDAVPIDDGYLIERKVKDGACIPFEYSGHFPFLTEKPKFLAVMDSFFEI